MIRVTKVQSYECYCETTILSACVCALLFISGEHGRCLSISTYHCLSQNTVREREINQRKYYKPRQGSVTLRPVYSDTIQLKSTSS